MLCYTVRESGRPLNGGEKESEYREVVGSMRVPVVNGISPYNMYGSRLKELGQYDEQLDIWTVEHLTV